MKLMGFGVKQAAVLAVATLFLGACAETQFIVHAAKRAVNAEKAGEPQKGKGHYKVGNPYQIKGVWYYPAVDYDYDETGIASWYGPNFDGRPTANGETFDMNLVSAAHRTLPMPSWVQVTNLDNGRTMKIRVNDRGPYAHGRIIDLSRRAAQLLGYERQGTARVRVQILPDDSRAEIVRMKGEKRLASLGSPITIEKAPKPTVATQQLPPPGATPPPPPPVKTAATHPVERTTGPTLTQSETVGVAAVPASTGIFVQAGAFSEFANANRVKAMLSGVGPVKVSSVLVNGRDLYRVRVGPIVNVAEADQILEAVIGAGYSNARVIVD